MSLFNKKDFELKFKISSLIKFFGTIFEFLYWNIFYHYWPNSESRFKIFYAKGSLTGFY